MVKLVILIEQPEDWPQFDSEWPTFLHFAEAMPGLQREATSRVDHLLFGKCQVGQMHELFFNSLADIEQALASTPGQAAGRVLQQITAGRVTLFIADHKEDDMANIRKHLITNQPSD